ncbi:hypothetical protein MASR1M107_07210 [Ignavibacteriales bacterium]
MSVAQAYIADVTTPQERAKGMGLIGVAFGLGFVFGPMLGGIFSKFGYEVTGFAKYFLFDTGVYTQAISTLPNLSKN